MVHIYAAREGLGHKTIRSGSDNERYLTLTKDEEWVTRLLTKYTYVNIRPVDRQGQPYPTGVLMIQASKGRCRVTTVVSDGDSEQ